MSGGGFYEFVVVGELGPLLRSMLIDMSIEDRPVQTCLRLTTIDDADLFAILTAVMTHEHQLERIRVYP